MLSRDLVLCLVTVASVGFALPVSAQGGVNYDGFMNIPTGGQGSRTSVLSPRPGTKPSPPSNRPLYPQSVNPPYNINRFPPYPKLNTTVYPKPKYPRTPKPGGGIVVIPHRTIVPKTPGNPLSAFDPRNIDPRAKVNGQTANRLRDTRIKIDGRHLDVLDGQQPSAGYGPVNRVPSSDYFRN